MKRLGQRMLAVSCIIALSCLVAAGVAVAEDEHDGKIDPVSAGFTFESPYIHTSVRPVFLYHEFPSDSIFQGGDLKVYAAQLRLALTERLALIATKDGFADLNPDAFSDDETGWLDLAAGVKYAVLDDEESGLTVTPGLIFELTQGSSDVFQGNGDGIVRPFVSAGLDLEDINLIGSIGLDYPLDRDKESTSFDYHAHVSFEVNDWFVPLVELNGIHYIDGGDVLPVNFEAVDYGNLGASMVDGNDIVTGAVGTRIRLSDWAHFGAAYEVPLTSREDIFDKRISLDLLLKF